MLKRFDILCVRTTGELVTLLRPLDNSEWEVRRAVNTRDEGIKHQHDAFFPEELETVQEHLEREAAELRQRAEILSKAKNLNGGLKLPDFTVQ